jgi:hypothetical protein
MIGAHVTHLSLYFKVWGRKQRNFSNSLTLCKQFLACELCVMDLYIYILPYFLPDKEIGFSPKGLFATGTMEVTAKSTIHLVSTD